MNLGEKEKPDIRLKIQEYIAALDLEINNLLDMVLKSHDSQVIMGEIKAYDNVRNDLRGMLDELI